MKGMELYAWREVSGEWRYALLPGTNRIKEPAEIVAQGMDFEAVLEAIARLAPGEIVFVSGATCCPEGGAGRFVLPPPEHRARLAQSAQAAGLILQGLE
jgi:hypothetical protein